MVKCTFKNVCPLIVMYRNFCVALYSIRLSYTPFLVRIYCKREQRISFKTFEECLRELERASTSKQIECINTLT